MPRGVEDIPEADLRELARWFGTKGVERRRLLKRYKVGRQKTEALAARKQVFLLFVCVVLFKALFKFCVCCSEARVFLWALERGAFGPEGAGAPLFVAFRCGAVSLFYWLEHQRDGFFAHGTDKGCGVARCLQGVKAVDGGHRAVQQARRALLAAHRVLLQRSFFGVSPYVGLNRAALLQAGGDMFASARGPKLPTKGGSVRSPNSDAVSMVQYVEVEQSCPVSQAALSWVWAVLANVLLYLWARFCRT